MRDTMLQGLGQHLVPIPHFVWQKHVSKAGHDTKAELGFMSEEHHRVRNLWLGNFPALANRCCRSGSHEV